MKKPFITKSSQETKNLALKLAAKLSNGTIIALYGNLGSGKTTFVQGLAKGLGINKKIISPSFIITRKYRLEIGNFYHIDLYRIENENAIEGLGLLEILNDPENIVAIEWPEKIEKLLPKKRINLDFKYLEDNKRQIILS